MSINSHGYGGNFFDFFFRCFSFPRNCEAKVCSGVAASRQSSAQRYELLGFVI
jgi:hypothetical protein